MSETTSPAARPLPVVVVAGLPGAGKTTLVNHLVGERSGERIVVIPHDASGADEDRLVGELRAAAGTPGVERIVIEVTGIGDPFSIAFAVDDESLEGHVQLSNLVTVVDASRFWADYGRNDMIADDDGNLAETALAPLLVEEIEEANVVVINKVDLVDEAALDDLEGYIHNLNPVAEIRRTVHGDVDVAWLLRSNRYADALTDHDHDHDHEHGAGEADEADEYGFNSFVYAPGRPFRWEPFTAMLEEWPDEVMRARGFAVFSDLAPAMLSMVRDAVELVVLGSDDEAGAASPDDETTELLFIGRGMPRQLIVDRLDACLAPDPAGSASE